MQRCIFSNRQTLRIAINSGTRKVDELAYDYVFDADNNPKLVEISYGFANKVYDPCTGYWDEQMNWHAGTFNPYGWMVELMLKTSK